MPADSKIEHGEGATSNGVRLQEHSTTSYKQLYIMAALIFVFILIGIIVPLAIVFLANGPSSNSISHQYEDSISTGNV